LKQRLPEQYNKLLRTGLICILSFFGYRSAAQNLIVNGSMTCGIVRSDTVAPGWYKYGDEQPNLNTPDINHDSGIVHCSPGWVWWGGTPVASPDGGTWQNVWRIENFAQTVYGLTIGTRYYFRYYYASQGISTGPPSGGALFPYAPDVTVIGATGYSNPSAGKLFEWNTYSGSLVATSDSIVIICSEGMYDGYIAYDGFYLGTNQPDNFLEVTAPDSVTLCGAGDASFSVQSAPGVSYQWQSGLGYTWDDVSDGGGVSGSKTNTLLVPNVTAALNNTQYRCLVTSSCCTAVSAPALLLVAPFPDPVLKTNVDVHDICGLASIVISTDSFYRDYLWNDNSKKQNLQVIHPGIYWVEVTDSNNCIGKDSIQIYSCEKIVAPNAFTPNGDGINDLFKPTVYGTVVNYTLTIYNRWGQMIFKSRDPGKGWDGTMSGVPQPDDTYIWNCLFQLLGNKPDHKSGTVILIR
jgi:gliding motility-associated-like protein